MKQTTCKTTQEFTSAVSANPGFLQGHLRAIGVDTDIKNYRSFCRHFFQGDLLFFQSDNKIRCDAVCGT